MKKSVRVALNFATNTPRDIALPLFQELCQTNNVYILESKLFSNVSLSIFFEGSLFSVKSLAESLKTNGFRIDSASQSELHGTADYSDKTEVTGTIQVTFANEDGDMRNPVPMVPG